MYDKKLERCCAQLVAADQKLLGRLRELFPKGATVSFHIMYGQKAPSTGTVVGYFTSRGGGGVRVEHLQAKPGSRFSHRDVPVSQIQGVFS